jgi:hypothetical protein
MPCPIAADVHGGGGASCANDNKISGVEGAQRGPRTTPTRGPSLAVHALAALSATAALSACLGPRPQHRLQEGRFSHHFDGEAKLSRRDAIARVVAVHPELRGVSANALPPGSIEAAPGPDYSWYVGFLRWGSGRPGVLQGRCFVVDETGRVSGRGHFNARAGQTVEHLNLADCRPTPSAL